MGRPGKKGGIWVELGVIGGENSRKPVFGFQLLEERLFCKGLILSLYNRILILKLILFSIKRYFDFKLGPQEFEPIPLIL